MPTKTNRSLANPPALRYGHFASGGGLIRSNSPPHPNIQFASAICKEPLVRKIRKVAVTALITATLAFAPALTASAAGSDFKGSSSTCKNEPYWGRTMFPVRNNESASLTMSFSTKANCKRVEAALGNINNATTSYAWNTATVYRYSSASYAYGWHKGGGATIKTRTNY